MPLRLSLTLCVLSAGCAPLPQTTDSPDPTGLVPDCRTTRDDALGPEELVTTHGTRALYVTNDPDQPVSPGLPADGTWDLRAGPAQVGATIGPMAVPEELRDSFPEADFALPAQLPWPELVGLYRLEESGASSTLWLLGSATLPGTDPARAIHTVYEPPVPALQLPLRAGDSWQAESRYRDARLAGLLEQGVERWFVEVTGQGSALLPGAIEVDQVLQLDIRIERTLALAPESHHDTIWQRSWYRPCFGEIARIVSTDVALDPVQEFRRLVP